ncbi:MAG: ArnT family glycosyltransferase [Tranquillimonas sp.]
MTGLLDRVDRGAAAAIAALGRHPRRAAAALLLIGLVALLPGQGALPLLDRDEARFVQGSRQMLESGDYIDIRNQEAPRYKKPVGIYWLQAGAAALSGQGAEAPMRVFRLPSLLGILAASMLIWWGSLPLAGPAAAALAGLAVATSVLTVGEAHIAKTDAALLAAVVAMQAGLIRTWQAAGPVPARWLFWGGAAVGTLLKGPIAPLIGALTLMGLLAHDRRAALWRRLRPLSGLALFAAVVLPWFIAIGIVSDGAFYRASFGEDLLGKVGQGAEGHDGPAGYYLATIWLTFWPWAPFALLALPWAWRARRRPPVVLVALWALPVWLLFSATGTKLPHYIMPALPPMAALAALWLVQGRFEFGAAAWLRAVAAVLLAGGAGILAALIVIAPLYLDLRPATLAVGMGAAGLLAALAAAWAMAADRLFAAAALSLAAALTLTPALIAGTLPRLAPLFPSERIAALDAALDACAPRPVLSVGYREMSLVARAGTDTEFPPVDTAADRLAEGDGWRVFVTSEGDADLELLRQGTGRPLAEIARFPSINYNQSDDRLSTVLVARADDPLLAPCLADLPFSTSRR